MKVLLDTNVIFAAFASTGFCYELVETISEHHEMVSSPQLLKELQSVLERHFGKEHPAQSSFLNYAKLIELAEPLPLPKPVCRDPADDWVLATAIAGNTQAIVTGVKDLLVLKKHKGIPIVTPRGFLEMVSGQ